MGRIQLKHSSDIREEVSRMRVGVEAPVLEDLGQDLLEREIGDPPGGIWICRCARPVGRERLALDPTPMGCRWNIANGSPLGKAVASAASSCRWLIAG